MNAPRRERRQAAKQALRRLGLDSSDSSESDSYYTAESDEGTDEEDNPVQAEEMPEAFDEWREVTVEDDQRAHVVPEFLGVQGVNPLFPVPEDIENGWDTILSQFLPDHLLHQLCEWTNKRVEQEVDKFHEEHDGEELPYGLKTWKACTIFEMKKVIGMLLCTGVIQKPEVSSYWSTDPLYFHPFIHDKACLPRARFQQIISWLRCYDCLHFDAADPLCKIRPFLEAVQRICKNCYLPTRDVAIDEALLLYKGRLHFKQYMPNKRAKFGIKLYCLAESTTGYMWNFLVHSTAGANNQFGNDVPQLSLSERIVIELSRDILDLGYRIFCDSWFSSVRLAEHLLTRSTALTGTIRKDRGIPQILRDLPLQPLSHSFARSGDVLVMKIVDRRSSGIKTVYLVDSASTAGCTQVRRVLRGGEEQQVLKPNSVLEYNQRMGGVDRMDAAAQTYSACRKTHKWFVKLSVFLLQQLVRNSWLIYKHLGGSQTFLAYTERCIKHLMLSSGDGRVRVHRRALCHQAGDADIHHRPQRLPPTEAQQRPAKRCRVCYQRGQQKRTVFFCGGCDGQPGLCVDQCFADWHSAN